MLREFIASCTIPLLGAAAVDYDMQQHLQRDSVLRTKTWRWPVATLRNFRLATWDHESQQSKDAQGIKVEGIRRD